MIYSVSLQLLCGGRFLSSFLHYGIESVFWDIFIFFCTLQNHFFPATKQILLSVYFFRGDFFFNRTRGTTYEKTTFTKFFFAGIFSLYPPYVAAAHVQQTTTCFA